MDAVVVVAFGHLKSGPLRGSLITWAEVWTSEASRQNMDSSRLLGVQTIGCKLTMSMLKASNKIFIHLIGMLLVCVLLSIRINVVVYQFSIESQWFE